MKTIRKITEAVLLLLCLQGSENIINARKWMSLNDAIKIAGQRSYSAKSARLQYVASYWAYRSFKAQLLPSVNLSGSLLGFDHSSVEARDADNGRINHVDNNSLTNSLTFSVDQEIPSLGGKVSLQSYLYRLDQFDYHLTTYNSQPLRISYTQPLRSYNELKWEKKTAPVEFEIAKREYLESMEYVALYTAELYFAAIQAQTNYRQSLGNHADLTNMYALAKKRYELGTTTKSELLQLELSMLNAKVAVANYKMELDNQLLALFSYLRLSDYEDAELTTPSETPNVVINADAAVRYALENASHAPTQNLTELQARQNVAKAHSQRGIQLQLNSEIGFNQTASTFKGAYSRLRDNEILGISLTLPIFDWGVSKGKVHMAEAKQQLAKVKIDMEREEYVQDVKKQAMQFAYQTEQCRLAKRAEEISAERYEITKKKFEEGSIEVNDLNTALKEAEDAKAQYVSQLKTFWTDYYTLQRTTLYDWISQRKITTDYDKLLDTRYDD